MNSKFCKLNAMVRAIVVFSSTVAIGLGQQPATEEQPPERAPETVLGRQFEEIEAKLKAELPPTTYEVAKGAARKVKLFKADPKLLENKFVASVQLVGIRNPWFRDASQSSVRGYDGLLIDELPDAAPRILDRSGRSLFSGIGYDAQLAKTSHSDHFKLLIPLCPKEMLPGKEILDFLASSDCDRVLSWQMGRTEGGIDWFVEVYAPSESVAQERIAAIKQLFDYGLCRALQFDCIVQGKQSIESIVKGRNEFDKLSQTIHDSEAQAAKSSEIGPDLLRDLKSQKIMTTIELAAIDARIKACNELLKEMENRGNRLRSQLDTVGEVKIKAEIDLAGIKEKLDKINVFIDEANQSFALQSEIVKLKRQQQRAMSQIQELLRRAETYARLVSLYAPLDLKDNQITVSPIEWTN